VRISLEPGEGNAFSKVPYGTTMNAHLEVREIKKKKGHCVGKEEGRAERGPQGRERGEKRALEGNP